MLARGKWGLGLGRGGQRGMRNEDNFNSVNNKKKKGKKNSKKQRSLIPFPLPSRMLDFCFVSFVTK